MSDRNQTIHQSRNKGSAILLVLILGISLMVILASQLNRGVTTKKLNIANSLLFEAKNAAESFAEYGCADIVKRFESKTSFTKDELKTDPIKIPDTAANFYKDSNLLLDETTVKGGQIENGYWVYLDPEDPRWEFDPLKGKKVFVRDINIFAKATTQSASLKNKKSTAFVQQTLQLRDSPLFSNAIFYNVDLELHPGPKMEVGGTVHSNRDAWLQANDSIKFHESVTATGKILHGNKRTSAIHTHLGKVLFKDENGNFIDMLLGGTGKEHDHWLDHRNTEWRELSSQVWDGNVQDSAHNVPSYNAAGIADHIPDDPYTTTDELENHAYAVIEPLLATTHPDRKSAAVRNQKMMAKACIIFRIEKDSTTQTGLRIKAYKWARNNNNIPINTQNPFDSTNGNLLVDNDGNPTLVEIKLPGKNNSPLTYDLIGSANEHMTAVDNYTTLNDISQPEKYEYSVGYVKRGLYDHHQELEISPVSLDIGKLRQLVDDNANASGTNLGETYWKDSASNTITFSPKTDWNGVIYVEFPLENNSGNATDKIVRADPSLSVSYQKTEPKYVKVADEEGDYMLLNGIYYSKSQKSTQWNRNPEKFRYDRDGTQTVTATQTIHLALQIIKGEFIPSPTFCEEEGLTIATNAPLYLVGNYNADGNVHTNDFKNYEVSHYKNKNGNYYNEPPASFICDSFTVLSEDWINHNRPYSQESNTGNRPVSSFTEVSAAILTGLKPTVPQGAPAEPTGGASSGGAHNFPRFLENWNTTLTLRTSMVALFESEVHTRPVPDNYSHYYSPPTRDWGFNQNFEEGNYPPGTPNVRAFRRTTFRDITKAEYEAGIAF